jgi:ribonuclease E
MHGTHDNHASPQQHAAPAPVVAAVAETVQQPVSAVSTPSFEAPVVEAPVVEAPVVEAPVVEAPVVEAPVVEAPAVAQVAVDHASTAEPVAHVDHVAKEDHVAHVAEVVHVAPPAAVVVPPSAPSTPAPVAAASIDVDAMLRAAGLQMTETNPERLRVVQAEQSATTPAMRAPRERKPAPPVSNEPLQQVETRN